jgi:hypothetical protein
MNKTTRSNPVQHKAAYHKPQVLELSSCSTAGGSVNAIEGMMMTAVNRKTNAAS